MHKRRSLAFLATFLFLVTLSAWAFAQSSGGSGGGPVSILTPSTAIVALLSLVAGFVAQAVNTGGILGRSLPVSWLPYVTLFGSFFANFAASVIGAPNLSDTTWFNACLAGGFALLASTGGITAHQHFTAKPGDKGAARGFAGLEVVGAIAMLGFLAFCGVLLSGCLSSAPIVPETPANQAQIQSCQNTASWHNDFVVGDFTFTTGAASLAGVVAVDSQLSPTEKTTLSAVGLGLGGAALLTSGLTAWSSSNFQNGQCAAVVGGLPAAPVAGAVGQ